MVEVSVQCSLLEEVVPSHKCLVDIGVQTQLHRTLPELTPTHNPKEFESSESEISEVSGETACADLSMASFNPSTESSST